ncbi:Transcriptional regulatory protein pro-1 [Leucoagaricus sp. SymC.cos]|nr:Transcriptional regulatory protein pro-1 [Leucoagaricus sp. SymC.cos]
MSYGTTTTTSPSGSPSPSTSPSSTSSPETPPTCLDPSTMHTHAESSQSARSTPSHSSIDLPRTQTASKGGCWTCRLRRKKCDEQREGDTCQTCKRLTIKCLGWGARRPEWMRDKKAVDDYKAGIKEQLNRAGLIRGQPRSQILNRNTSSRATAAVAARPPITHRASAPEVPASSQSSLGLISNGSHEDLPFFANPIFNTNEPYGFPEVPGASSSVFNNMFYGVQVDPNGMGMVPMNDMYSEPQLQSLPNPALQFETMPDFGSFPSDGFIEQPAPHFSPSQQAINIDQVLFEFNHARRMLFRFDAYGVVSSITYNLMKQDPAGPVTKTARALGQLHQKRMRVSQGMEPDTKPEHSPAVYYRNEALMQMRGNKDLQRSLTDADAIAALYLVLFSQLGGCFTDWDEPFTILCDWVVQTGLPVTQEPWLFFQGMSPAGRLAVKGALWIDILASITAGRGPKFFGLWRRLLGERGTYWDQNNMPFQRGLRMDTLTGCPDEALLMMAEVSVLAQWKSNAQREGTLSYRELIRKGDVMEQRLKQNVTDTRLINDVNLKLIPNETVGEPDVAFPSDDARAVVADLFREASVLHLHTVLSGPCPGVPEISKCVQNIVQLLGRSPSEVERGVVLPIALAGCMTNDSAQRDFLRGRFQAQNESIGNLMQARVLMEILWQKRDVNVLPGGVSLLETVQEKNLRLLLI